MTMEKTKEKCNVKDATIMLELAHEGKQLEKIITFDLNKEFDTLEIYPLSDIHIGAPETDIQAFREFLKHIKAKENRYLILNGDLVNNAIKSSVSNVYEETMSPNKQKKFIIEELKEVKDRIIVITSGNHEARSKKEVDTDITEDIAESLGISNKYRADDALIKVTFGKNGGRENKKQCYSIYVTHGNGGGKRPGGTINNIELLGLSIDADIYCIGHAHKRMAYKSMYRRADLRNNVLVETERLFVVSSHWQEFASYAKRKMLTPSAKGSVPIILYGKEKKADAII